MVDENQILQINRVLGWFGGEFVVQLIVISAIFLPCKKRSLWGLRYIFGLGIILLFGQVKIEAPWYYVVHFVLNGIMAAFVYRYRPLQILFMSICMYCLQHIASCTSYGIIFLVVTLGKDFGLYNYYYIIMPVVCVATMVGAYFTIVKRIKNSGDFRFNNKVMLFIACAFLLVAAVLTHYVRQMMFWQFSALASLMGIAVLFAVLVLVILFMNIRAVSLRQENIILTQLLNKDKQRYEQNKISNEKIQIKYHDLKKLQSGGIINYSELSEVDGDREVLFSTYFTGNTALDVVLSEKALMCERLGIRFICTADGKAVDFMKPYHIYSFMVNALENCIESVRKREDHRELEVLVVRKNNMCVIKTVNYTDREKLEMYDGVPKTTKTNKEEHGFGVKSMRNVVGLYGGNVRFYVENHNFTVVAVIPIPPEEKEKKTRNIN